MGLLSGPAWRQAQVVGQFEALAERNTQVIDDALALHNTEDVTVPSWHEIAPDAESPDMPQWACLVFLPTPPRRGYPLTRTLSLAGSIHRAVHALPSDLSAQELRDTSQQVSVTKGPLDARQLSSGIYLPAPMDLRPLAREGLASTAWLRFPDEQSLIDRRLVGYDFTISSLEHMIGEARAYREVMDVAEPRAAVG